MPALALLLFSSLALLWSSHAIPVLSSTPSSAPALSERASGGFELPIQRRRLPRNDLQRRGDITGTIGLGDNADLIYTVPIEIGNTVTAVHLDTGSADLWSVSDACTSQQCVNPSVTKLTSSSLNLTGASVTMRYGDSTTGTQASGPVAIDTATIAGISMAQQPFAAINSTTNPTVQYGSAGIFGLGFPSGSVIQKAVVQHNKGKVTSDDVLLASEQYGPLLSRIASTEQLSNPMFSIALQRDTIDIGGGNGALTVGKLPDGVDNSSLTWVPVRLYRAEDGGPSPPSFAPNEVYPYRWEIDIDAVFINGEKLPASTIPAQTGVDTSRTSALIDTGNSLLRGPQDVVNAVWGKIAPSFDTSQAGRSPIVPCSTPYNMAFQIGGKMFPIDPRDFIGDLKSGDTQNCVADNLVNTDPPSKGALFRWSLGDPFFKSNLIAFHYGNLTHPSVDPPRIGIMSNVPSNANDLLVQAVNDAKANGGNFESSLVAAPTAQAASEGQVTVSFTDLPAATSVSATSASNDRKGNSASGLRVYPSIGLTLSFVLSLLLC